MGLQFSVNAFDWLRTCLVAEICLLCTHPIVLGLFFGRKIYWNFCSGIDCHRHCFRSRWPFDSLHFICLECDRFF